MQLSVIVFLVIVCTIVLNNCSSLRKNSAENSNRSPQSISEIKLNQDSWQYFNSMTIAELKDKMVEMNYISADDKELIALPSDKSWDQALNEVFERAVDIVENSVGNGVGPRPRLVIFKSSAPNAFVASATSCLGIPIIAGDQTPNNRRWKIPEFRAIGGHLHLMVTSNSFCKSFLSERERRQFIDSVKGHTYYRGQIRCKIDENQNDSRKLKVTCDKRQMSELDLLVHKTLPFVIVSSGLLSVLQSWDEVLAILFHELGHYYLPHTNAREAERYDYFYSQAAQQSPWYPTEDISLNETGNILLYLGKLKTVESIEEYYGTELSTRILKSIIGLKALYLEDRRFTFDLNSCSGILGSVDEFDKAGGSHGNGYSYLNQIGDLFRTKLSGQLKEYNYKEKGNPIIRARLVQSLEKLKICAQTIALKPNLDEAEYGINGIFDKNSVSYSNQSLEYIGILIRGMNLWDPLAFFLRGQSIPNFDNAWEAYRFIDSYLKSGLESLTSDPRFHDTGHYTFEEEADIFALEMLALVELKPDVMKNALFTLMKKISEHPKYIHTTAEPSFEKCKEADENSWIDHGQPFKPPLSDYSSKHHNFCHRIYNIARFENFNNLGGSEVAPFEWPQLEYSVVKRKNTGWMRWLGIQW